MKKYQTIKNDHLDFMNEVRGVVDVGTLSDNELWALMFISNRSMRLTKTGFHLIKDHIDHHDVEIEQSCQIPRTSYFLYLDRYLKKPYFYDIKNIIMFDPEDALELILINGDLDIYLKMKKRSEKANKS